MLEARMNDGRFGPPPALYPPAPGIWRPTPPNFANDPAPWVGNVRPFIVPSAEMLRTGRAERAHQCRLRGGLQRGQGGRLTHEHDPNGGRDRCCDLLAGPSDGALEPDLSHAGRQPGTWTSSSSARLFAMENLAAADALIGCWNDKYYWQFWRPITAIREADTDGNPATEADPTWLPLFDPATPVCNPPPLFTPPFPDHPSGHACATSCVRAHAQELLRHRQDWLQRLQQQIRTTRSFDRFSDALKEVIDARVWAGIHFRTADTQGAVLGKKVAHYLKKHYFQPVR